MTVCTQPASQPTYCRMNWTASSYFIPHSIRARATRTGALRGHAAIRGRTENSEESQSFQLRLTCPAPPRSGQPRSSRAPPGTSASAGSASHPRSGWREELHHRRANPEEAERMLAWVPGNQPQRSPEPAVCGGEGGGSSWGNWLPVFNGS